MSWYDDFRLVMRVKTVEELEMELKTLDYMEAIVNDAIKAAKTSLAAIDKSTSAIPALHVIEGMEANNAITRRQILWLLNEIDIRNSDND